ncbi:MAG TPA: MazG nucleotide pyrophosphohydrolase domain-containing protein [Candidatus Saccharimonadales bacterium]|nr:MazG nucleotide pyrophosphohydrolase domain-containing protein [Candidatus Saccharimonadales bacterium]
MPSQLPEKPTLGDFQADIKRLVAERGWDDETIQDIFLLMVEEVGELAKELRKTIGMHVDVAKTTTTDHAKLEGEFADIFNYLLDLANKLGVDLERAYRNKMKEVEGRTWK